TEMNALIRAIHSDLLKLKKTTPWLSEYDEKALSQSDGHFLIYYTPTAQPGTAPQPQQPDHLSLSDIAIDRSSGAKYSNAFEEETVCRFPTLGRKIYGEVLVWNDRQLEKLLKHVV